ncbi:hypothetical protein GBAR_LOCUS13670 [Geodia barretti]|uniref:Sortase n=1 Tax=Geodia barretti TaxID=519541 RepID=A0AA35S4P4_GEOBA|nr:hypothetical protein GBAR_LOCUS13670 [Geodia barretti]
MEIGLDYMQMRTRAQHYGMRWSGIALLLLGVVLVAAGVFYYGHLFWLRSGLDDYAVQRQGVVVAEPNESVPSGADGVTVTALTLPEGAFAEQAAELGFELIRAADAAAVGTLPPAVSVKVPALGIDARISEFTGTLRLSAYPGERGAMWLLGPAGKGAAGFGRLTGAADVLKENENLVITVKSGTNEYIYLSTHTQVVSASDLRLTSAERSTVHLAVPVPSGFYDHFLILNGELVGVR